ncbi:MAG: PaaI family thioesterase [Actinomycetota bacterium]|nr:PaaI family thioesterase [Actinomycetota bacterium]
MSAPTVDHLPWAHPSPFIDRLGDLRRHAGDPHRFGFVVDEPKLNGRGFLHGGAVATIADVCIGHALSAAATEPATRFVTVDLKVTLVGTGEAGAWVDVVVEPERIGRRLASGTARFRAGDRTIAHASAVFLPAG